MDSSVQNLRKIIGPFPDKVPLEAKILESINCGPFFREKVEYTTEENDRIRAFILIPKKITEKTPAIYCHHQHAGNYTLGKSEVVGLNGEPDQSYARELAKLGFIAFAPDSISFDEPET